VTLFFSLLRARSQPGVSVGFGGTSATIVPADVLLVVLGLVSLVSLSRSRPGRGAAVAITSAIFSALLILTAAANGATAFVSAGKLVELTALALGIVAFVRTEQQLEAVVDVLILLTIAADAVGIERFIAGGGGRQASFLGEHDFAALAALPLLYGLTQLAGRSTARAWIAVVAGAVGCMLGAALASLLGLYIGAAALIAVTVAARSLRSRHVATIVVVLAAVTAGTLVLRSGDLGFLQSWFGRPPSRPGQYASSWSQRLIYAYIGGRIFLAHPVLGTGWYGNLPPKEFTVYLPDARRRFSDQPPRYFPPPDAPFVPQQAFDQVLYELGVVGAASFLALLVAIGRASVRAARAGTRAIRALPGAWLGATVGALAGEGLFGGTPLAAILWLVAGLAVALAARPRELA
jgi:hypothetical protein